jgi:4-carboxymuconolactone decarboxylase
MARIPYVSKDNTSQEISELFTKIESNGAVVLNLWKMAAHSPATLQHMVRMGNAILSKTEVDPKLREIAILRVAELLNCEYERKAHVVLAKRAGVTDEQVADIKNRESSSAFNPIEQAILRFTDEITKDGKASQSTFSELAKHLSHREMMELTITIGFYGMLARLILTFDVDLEDTNLTPSKIVGRSSE